MCDCKPINQAVIVAANPYWTGIAANITKNRTQLYAKSLKCMCVCVRYAYALAPTNICLQYVYMCMCMHEKNFKLFIKPSNCLSSYQFCKQAFSIRLICVHTFIHTYICICIPNLWLCNFNIFFLQFQHLAVHAISHSKRIAILNILDFWQMTASSSGDSRACIHNCAEWCLFLFRFYWCAVTAYRFLLVQYYRIFP